MKNNQNTNMGNMLGRRMKDSMTSIANNGKTSEDLSIMSVRGGLQQRYGAMQLEAMIPNQYALFGTWSNSSTTVGP